MKKIFIFIFVLTSFIMANTPLTIRGDVMIMMEQKQLLNIKVGTDFNGVLYEPNTESTFLVYGRYGYDDGYFKGHEFGLGIGYGCELFGLHTNLITLELGRNSQGDIYYQVETGYMPVNSINLSMVIRYDNSISPDGRAEGTPHIGGMIGFAFGKTEHIKTQKEIIQERESAKRQQFLDAERAYYMSVYKTAAVDTTKDSVYVPQNYSTPVNYSGGYTYVRGHLRTTKTGKVTYVRPYYRRK